MLKKLLLGIAIAMLAHTGALAWGVGKGSSPSIGGHHMHSPGFSPGASAARAGSAGWAGRFRGGVAGAVHSPGFTANSGALPGAGKWSGSFKGGHHHSPGATATTTTTKQATTAPVKSADTNSPPPGGCGDTNSPPCTMPTSVTQTQSQGQSQTQTANSNSNSNAIATNNNTNNIGANATGGKAIAKNGNQSVVVQAPAASSASAGGTSVTVFAPIIAIGGDTNNYEKTLVTTERRPIRKCPPHMRMINQVCALSSHGDAGDNKAIASDKPVVLKEQPARLVKPAQGSKLYNASNRL